MDEINEDEDESTDVTEGNVKIIVKSSDPEKFVGSITKSADKLLGNICSFILYCECFKSVLKP